MRNGWIWLLIVLAGLAFVLWRRPDLRRELHRVVRISAWVLVISGVGLLCWRLWRY